MKPVFSFQIAHWLPPCLVLGLTSAGCIVSGPRCDEHQVQVHNAYFEYCKCDDTSVPSVLGYGCTACAANEVAKGGACECADGYTRDDNDSPCRALNSGEITLGFDCDSDSDCGGKYPLCDLSLGDGYCTSVGCTKHSDCFGNYYCVDGESDTFCHAPPTGLNASCASSADCAGYEANYCDELSSHSCIVSGCAANPSVCKGDWVCCDYSIVGVADICVPDSSLENGKCPVIGTEPVKP